MKPEDKKMIGGTLNQRQRWKQYQRFTSAGLKGLEFIVQVMWYFPGGAAVKNLPAHIGGIRDKGLIPGLGRFPGRGRGTPLQHVFHFLTPKTFCIGVQQLIPINYSIITNKQCDSLR